MIVEQTTLYHRGEGTCSIYMMNIYSNVNMMCDGYSNVSKAIDEARYGCSL